MKLDVTNHPHVYERNDCYFMDIRFSRSEQARQLGAVWCVHERKWRIHKHHANAPMLIGMTGFDERTLHLAAQAPKRSTEEEH
jgi:hypothetical protein